MTKSIWKAKPGGWHSGVLLGALLLWTSCTWGGPACEYLTATYGWACDPEYATWTCDEGPWWELPLDLDGDGVSDFVLSKRWAGSGCEYRYPYFASSRWTTVETWALFPEAHVQVLGWTTFTAPVFPKGYPIMPDPSLVSPAWPRSMWANPSLQPSIRAYGLGDTGERFSCVSSTCPLPRSIGWVRAGQGFPLFGIRVARTDGWHLGWIRVAHYYPLKDLGDGRTTTVDLDDFAIHPDPDTEINAGEPPRPRLWYDVEGDALRLRWLPVWTEYRLERTRTLTGAAWEPVSGVTSQSATLPARDGPWFFRLNRPDPPDPHPDLAPGPDAP